MDSLNERRDSFESVERKEDEEDEFYTNARLTTAINCEDSEEMRLNAIMMSERQKILTDSKDDEKEYDTTMQHYYGQNRVNLRESKSAY